MAVLAVANVQTHAIKRNDTPSAALALGELIVAACNKKCACMCKTTDPTPANRESLLLVYHQSQRRSTDNDRP